VVVSRSLGLRLGSCSKNISLGDSDSDNDGGGMAMGAAVGGATFIGLDRGVENSTGTSLLEKTGPGSGIRCCCCMNDADDDDDDKGFLLFRWAFWLRSRRSDDSSRIGVVIAAAADVAAAFLEERAVRVLGRCALFLR